MHFAFCQWHFGEDLIEHVLLSGVSLQGLDLMRFRKFASKVMMSSSSVHTLMEIKSFSHCIAANKQQACGLAAAASCGMAAACEIFVCKLVFLLLVWATLRLLVAATLQL